VLQVILSDHNNPLLFLRPTINTSREGYGSNAQRMLSDAKLSDSKVKCMDIQAKTSIVLDKSRNHLILSRKSYIQGKS